MSSARCSAVRRYRVFWGRNAKGRVARLRISIKMRQPHRRLLRDVAPVAPGERSGEWCYQGYVHVEVPYAGHSMSQCNKRLPDTEANGWSVCRHAEGRSAIRKPNKAGEPGRGSWQASIENEKAGRYQNVDGDPRGNRQVDAQETRRFSSSTSPPV